jgi:dienelactone hydrolase
VKTILFFTIASILFARAFAQLPGFTLTGNPQSATGASWTYQDSVNGVLYDLKGILFKPVSANSSLPAVVINHGTGGNVNGYGKAVSQKMVQWGFVCIATNLCHSAGVPIGSPGDTSMVNWGASGNNYLRDLKCREILASLGYVDTNCVMSFGHSRGAYTTTGLVATYPGKFSCAGHTSGGAITQAGYSAPTTTLASQINIPYIIHHGDADNVVPAFYDSTLNNVFNNSGNPHQFYVYAGYTHSQMSMDSLMFERTRNWFLSHLCSNTSVIQESPIPSYPEIFPLPTGDFYFIKFQGRRFDVDLFDITGKLFTSFKGNKDIIKIHSANFPVMHYIVRIKAGNELFTRRITAR